MPMKLENIYRFDIHKKMSIPRLDAMSARDDRCEIQRALGLPRSHSEAQYISFVHIQGAN
jgi:hypothetical protein